jgi:hypothetical protein
MEGKALVWFPELCGKTTTTEKPVILCRYLKDTIHKKKVTNQLVSFIPRRLL